MIYIQNKDLSDKNSQTKLRKLEYRKTRSDLELN